MKSPVKQEVKPGDLHGVKLNLVITVNILFNENNNPLNELLMNRSEIL
jgi:hypothetical protein